MGEHGYVGFDPEGGHDVATHDVIYAIADGLELSATVYTPIGAAGAAPAAVDLHGGAWRYFDRAVDAFWSEALASCGMVVVSLDFRQAPDATWPASAADGVAGVRWARAHAADLGVDPSRIGIIGGSSGGQLALAVALSGRHRLDLSTTAPAEVNAPDEIDPSVAWVAAGWPVAEPDKRYDYLQAVRADPEFAITEPMFDVERLLRAHERYFVDMDAMRDASIVRMLEDGHHGPLPPLWLAQPELDQNVPVEMSERLHKAYAAAGGDVEYVLFEGVGHSFANFGGEPGDRFLAALTPWLARQLNG